MKIHFTSLGCARNLVDSEVMLGILLRAGYEITEELKQADFLVVNTCGFLEVARQESIDTIELLVKEKKKGAKVVVAGCMVQKYGPGIEEKFPGVHYFLGSGDMEKILDAVTVPEAGSSITSARSYLQQGEVPRQLSTPRHFAYLKIAEGCMKRCAFCIIPNIKGPLKSKAQAQVIKEFRALLSQGVKEVILIAQDLGDFGKERREKNGLETLLKQMLHEEGDYWIRLLYLYPDEITDELIDLISSDKRICPYLDMPIQHVSDTMLKAMRRKTSRADIISIITKLRERIPGIVIRTSLMVGFPGETDDQFAELLQFVEEHPLDNVGIFKYSREEESHSAKLSDHIAEDVKQARFEALTAKQHEMVRRQNERFVGQKLQVIVEGTHPDSPLLMRGRFYGQCPDIDGQVIITDGRKVTAFGERYHVEITGTADYDLIGRVVSPVRKLCLV